MSKKSNNERQQKVYDSCPHCGHDLSPWEKVLLGVDRALTCKHCWYRILLDSAKSDQKPSQENK
ncbi:MAG: hypothetical protein HY800_00960 [Ignavibacteriales bacterium]|nr:hypothetical protein [Ignavibacteriales bacterium]